jgi:hypothetical protein
MAATDDDIIRQRLQRGKSSGAVRRVTMQG